MLWCWTIPNQIIRAIRPKVHHHVWHPIKRGVKHVATHKATSIASATIVCVVIGTPTPSYAPAPSNEFPREFPSAFPYGGIPVDFSGLGAAAFGPAFSTPNLSTPELFEQSTSTPTLIPNLTPSTIPFVLETPPTEITQPQLETILAPVPEPSTLLILAAALATLFLTRKLCRG